MAKQMHDQGMSLRKISAELAARGYVTAAGKPYVASAVQTMPSSRGLATPPRQRRHARQRCSRTDRHRYRRRLCAVPSISR